MGDGRFVACCVTKIQNKQIYKNTTFLEGFLSFKLFELPGRSRNQGLEKSELYCINTKSNKSVVGVFMKGIANQKITLHGL